MYLSKLEIFGFKSFANKTNLVLTNGITAIVGPNGCGKTNIVDALRWALGEQRYSTLRSDKMEDVIFNGSKAKKPIGMAEVSLTIENNKGILPLEYNEVTITRRVYRSGESEYLLNKTVCRLKDIVHLFMDTGMGANAYSVIELKMVETILSDKMEERRRLFEEAAGVTRYKARRKEALRKLEDVDADLLRVDDIINEVSKTAASLNRQARKAERYNEIQERLRNLEIEVLQRDYNSLFERLIPLEIRLNSTIDERESMRLHMEEEEALLDVTKSELSDIEQRLYKHRERHTTLLNQSYETRQSLLVSEERARSLKQRSERLTESVDSYEQRIVVIDKAKNEMTAQLELQAGELETLEGENQKYREVHKAIEEQLTEKKLQSETRQSRRMNIVQELTALESESERSIVRQQEIADSVERIDIEDADANTSLDQLRSQVEEQGKGQAVLSDTVIKAEKQFHLMEERKHTVRTEIDRLQNRAFEIQSHIGEKMTKIDFLNGLVDRLEGYNESVQHLLRNHDWSASRRNTVADAVNTREDLRIAIEAALGDAAHYILVNDLNEALSGLKNLKEHQKGKATFACLSRVPETKSSTFAIAGDGIIGWAVDLIRFDTVHHNLFHFLLRRVLVVRDSEVAHICIREYPDLRCVTIQGDLLDSRGIVRGGSHSQEEGSMIGKKDQIASLSREVVELKQQLLDNQSTLGELNEEYNSIDLRNYAEQMKHSQQELSAHERRIAQIVFEVEKQERIIQKNAEERYRLEDERTRIDARVMQIRPKMETLRNEKEEVENEVQQEAVILSELEKTYNLSMEKLNRANVAVVEKRGEIQNMRNEFERLSASLREAERALLQAQEEIIQAQDALSSLDEDITRLKTEAMLQTEEENSSKNELQAIESELEQKREESKRIERLLQGNRQKQDQTIALVHETELKVAEIRQRSATLEDLARNEYEMELSRISESEENVFDLAQAKEEINDLRQKIRALGPVNPLAFEEWKEEKERLDILTTQREDLIVSQHTLRDTIREINETAKQKFTETFNQVRENFIRIFKSLFDEGDEADLIIGSNEDPLEARIDIIAKPQGKRPHSIDMLSGGEKTLTAIALLFGIYLVKPSPFCILDEVDAPLDDANIDRFIRILRDFSTNTQFIVVTHNKRTMADADTLYGVTMEEEGVSKLVAVNFNQETVAKYAHN